MNLGVIICVGVLAVIVVLRIIWSIFKTICSVLCLALVLGAAAYVVHHFKLYPHIAGLFS